MATQSKQTNCQLVLLFTPAYLPLLITHTHLRYRERERERDRERERERERKEKGKKHKKPVTHYPFLPGLCNALLCMHHHAMMASACV